MKHRIAWVASIAVIVIGLTPSLADARGGAEAMLREASKLEGVEAAAIYGRVVPMIRGNLYAEKRVADAIEKLLEKADRSGQAGAAHLQKVLAALLVGMDHARSGAYISAHALAREALITATRYGEFEAVPVASKVLTKYSRGRSRGLAAKMMADYGAGLSALTAAEKTPETTAAGIKRLDAALTVCVKQKWYEMATTIATELAVAHLAEKQPDLARDALARAATAGVGSYPERDILLKWDGAAKRRLKDAPVETLAPISKALAGLKGMSAAAAGGAGGAGAPGLDAGEDPATDLGKAWRRLKKKGAVVTVKRGSISLTIQLAYLKAKPEETWQHRTGCRFKRIGDVVLAFHGMAVALEKITLKQPEDGVPGNSSVRNRWKPWTLLAKGETWTFGKDGQVLVR
jgi:hypothetical protein